MAKDAFHGPLEQIDPCCYRIAVDGLIFANAKLIEAVKLDQAGRKTAPSRRSDRGPVATPKDRSCFLAKLDEMINAVRQAHPPEQNGSLIAERRFAMIQMGLMHSATKGDDNVGRR